MNHEKRKETALKKTKLKNHLVQFWYWYMDLNNSRLNGCFLTKLEWCYLRIKTYNIFLKELPALTDNVIIWSIFGK